MKQINILLIIIFFLVGSVQAENMTHYPEEGIRRILVITVTENSATITWQTNSKEIDTINYWCQDENPGKTPEAIKFTESKAIRFHEVTLAGLKANKIYHYFIKGSSGTTYLHHFQTLMALPGKPEFTMAVIADTQFDCEDSGRISLFRSIVLELNQKEVDFVVFPGDLVEEGSEETFKCFKKIADLLEMPYFVATGNHERLYKPGRREAFLKVFNLKNTYYSVDLFGRHFIFLDCVQSEKWRPDAKQIEWLKQDLNSHKEKDVFIIIHYAVANDPYVFDAGRGVMPGIQKIFEQHGRIRAVYNGHKNVISATAQNNILYVSCPQPSTGVGYLIVRVYLTGLIQTFHADPGHIKNLRAPCAGKRDTSNPYKIRWDPLYRLGRPEVRNFTWRFNESVLPTAILHEDGNQKLKEYSIPLSYLLALILPLIALILFLLFVIRKQRNRSRVE